MGIGARFRRILWTAGGCLAATALAAPLALAANVQGPIGCATLSPGDSGFPVRVLQGDLAQLGFFAGAVTGSFDRQTAGALEAFQRRHGLAARGVLDAASFRAILQAMGLGAAGAPACAAAGGRRGASGGSAGQGGQAGGATGPAAGGTFVQGTGSPTVRGGLRLGGTIDGLTIVRVVQLTATAYGATAQDNYPYGAVDAFGAPLRPGDVAVDPSVIALGTKMFVTGYRTPYLPAGGELAVARDTGGAIKGARIDLYINSTDEALINSFGIQQVTAYLLG